LLKKEKLSGSKIRISNWSLILNSVKKLSQKTSNPSMPFMIGNSLVLQEYSLISALVLFGKIAKALPTS
jgi:hypothetical protein